MSKLFADVGILGCGPSALVAANALHKMGHQVRLFSKPDLTGKPRPSFIAGAQYSHEAVLGLNDPTRPDALVQVERHGTRDGYAKKVYGDPQAPVSWDRYQDAEYPAWNLRRIYRNLWNTWQTRVMPLEIQSLSTRFLAEEGYLFAWHEDRALKVHCDAWISTIPLERLCFNLGHQFINQTVHITQYEDSPQQDRIVYNGEDSPGWYRCSHLFGHTAYEYSGDKRPPLEGIRTITKPVTTNCDCYAQPKVPMLMTGRYGRWDKNVLVDTVQDEALDFSVKLREL